MKLRHWLVALVSATLALSGCSAGAGNGGNGSEKEASQSAASNAPLTVGLTYVPDIQFAPLYVAQEKGYFAEEGLDIKLRHHGAQEGLLTALQGGSEDVVFAGGDEMLEGRSNGVDVVNWATMYQKYPVTLIVPEDSKIHTPADLVGNSIGLPGPYGENYYALQAMLQAYDLEGKVDVQYIGYTQAAALSSKQVDSVVGFSNSDVHSIARQGMSVRTVEMMEGGLPLVGVGLGSLRPTLEARSEDFTRLIRALDKAVAFARENPEETVNITEKFVPSLAEPEEQANALKVLDSTLNLYEGAEVFGSQDAQRWGEMAEFMGQKILQVPLDVESAYVDLTK